MSIVIDGRTTCEVYHGPQAIGEVYHGADLIWSTRRGSTMDWQWNRARSQALRMMFIGSSTIQGHGVAWSEGLVYQLTGYIASHLPGVEATAMVKSTSGSRSALTAPGFHFLNAGVGGTTAENYFGPDRDALNRSFQPHFVVHMVGSNDYSLQRPLSDYRSNLREVVGDIRNRGVAGGPMQLLIHAPRREDVNDAAVALTWSDYGRVLQEVAEEFPNTEFLDAGDLFDRARDGAAVLAADRVHLNERGNSILAQVIAEWWGLDAHEDERIYGFDVADWDNLDSGTRLSSFTPDGVLQSSTRMTASGDHRPTLWNSTGGRFLDFTGGNRKMQTDDWGGVHAAPLSFYAVFDALTDPSATGAQAIFSRSGTDSGYLWAWYDQPNGLLKAASSTALSPGVPIGGELLTERLVLAVSYLPSGGQHIYLNSLSGQHVPVQSPDTTRGPWMRSLKLGTNAGETQWSQMQVREMWWHHGADPTTVQRRISALAAKHGIKITTRVSDWSETTSAAAIDATVPDWADTVELVAVGAGGGGAGGGLFSTGDGGRAGSWAHTSVQATAGATLTAQPGLGGSGGSSNSSNGSAGGDAIVRVDGQEVLRASGGGPGTSTNGNQPGRAAGNHSAFGRTFTGGGNASNGQSGNPPGGGGGPGAPLNSGNPGGQGRVWWRFTTH